MTTNQTVYDMYKNRPPILYSTPTNPQYQYQHVPSSQVVYFNPTYSQQIVNNYPYMTQIQQLQTIDTSQIVRLKDCNPKDIVMITKNRIIQENVIKVPLVSKQKQQKFKRVEVKSKQQSQEDQAQQNQELFNYEKMMKQKRDRKQKFLSDIERKINQAERDAYQLQEKFKQEGQQLKNIDALQTKLNDKIKNQLVNQEVCKLQRQIQERQDQKKNKKIQIGMEINQIKRVIQNEQQLNQQATDQADQIINRARGIKPVKQTHIEKTKQKPPRPPQKLAAPTVTSFNLTRNFKK